jgi:hypothetical protein
MFPLELQGLVPAQSHSKASRNASNCSPGKLTRPVCDRRRRRHDVTSLTAPTMGTPYDHSQVMKALYPASHEVANLSHSQLALKIARHSPCSACNTCTGLHPSQDVEVVLVNSPGFGEYDGATVSYLEKCSCGHGVTCHGANETEVGHDEFARRGRVAIRLDEFLQVQPIVFFFGPTPS